MLHGSTAEMWEMQFRNQHMLKLPQKYVFSLFFFLFFLFVCVWQVVQSHILLLPELQLSELQDQ